MNDSASLKKNMAKSGACNIQVGVRVRPVIARESSDILRWQCEGNKIYRIDMDKIVNPMEFDKVFNESSTSQEIFESMVEPLIKKAVDGFNATVLAYGQTSSGKTFTMIGDEREQGIIPLTFDYLFKAIDNLTEQRSFLIGVSFLEVYNEKIRDLLYKEKESLNEKEREKEKEKSEDVKLHAESDGNIKADCNIEMVSDPREMMSLMDVGNSIKAIGETKMNERSSRSHTIFRIHIESQEDKDGSVRVSQINLVDLAGSERSSATGATGQRLKEGCAINLSLLQLGNVVQKLSEDKGGHIDYRSSKLTRLLQTSLAGNANISMICNITPVAAEQSQSTLLFASRASTIKLSPHLTEVMDDATTIRKHAKRIKELEQKLQKSEYLEEKNLELQEEMTKMRALVIMSSFSRQEVLDDQTRANRRQTWAGGNFTKMKPLVPLLAPLYEESFGVSRTSRSTFASDRHLTFDRSFDVSSLSSEEQPSAFDNRSSIASNASSRPSLNVAESTPIMPMKQLSHLQNNELISETPPATLRMRILQLESRISQLSQVANTSSEVLEQRLSEFPTSPIIEIKKRLLESVTELGTPPAKLREQKQLLESEVVTLEKELDSLREFTTLERQLLAAEETEKLQSKVESLKHTIEDTESLYLNTASRCQALAAEKEEMQQLMTQLQKELDVNKMWIARNNEQQLTWRRELVEYKDKLASVSNEARDWQDEKELLKARYESKIAELQQCLNEAWTQNDVSSKSAGDETSMEQQYQNLKLELEMKEAALLNATSDVEHLKNELSQKNEEVVVQQKEESRKFEEQGDSLREKVFFKDQEIENLKTELKHKEDALLNATSDVEQLKNEFSPKNDEFISLQKGGSNKFEDHSDTLREKDQEIENLKVELKCKEDALLHATSNVEQLKNEFSQKNDESISQEKGGSSKFEDHSDSLREKDEEIENLKVELKCKEDALLNATSDVEQLKNEFSQKNVESISQEKGGSSKFEDLSHTLREKDQEIENLKVELKCKEDALLHATSNVEELKIELSQNYADAILQQKEETSKFEEQCDSLREKMFFMNQEIENLKTELGVKQVSLQYANSEVEKFKSELFQSNKNHGVALQQKEESYNLELEELRSEIRELCKEKTVADISIQENILDSEMVEKLDAAAKENSSLIGQLELITQEKEAMQIQLEDLSVSHEQLQSKAQLDQASIEHLKNKIEEYEVEKTEASCQSDKVFEYQHDSITVTEDQLSLIEELQHENVDLKSRLESLQTTFEESFDMKMTEQQLEEQGKTLAAQNCQLTQQLSKTLDDIKERGLLTELLKHQLSTSPEIEEFIASQVQELIDTRDSLQSDLVSLKQELVSLNIENTNLADKLQMCHENEKEQINSQDELKKQISSLQEQLKHSDTTKLPTEVVSCMQNLVTEITGLDKSYTKESLMDKNLQDIVHLFIRIIIEKQQECNTNMQSQITNLERKNCELKSDLLECNKERDSLKCSKENVHQELICIQERLSVCLAESSELSEEKSRLEVKVQELLSTLNQSEHEHSKTVSSLQSTLQQSQLQTETLEKRLIESSQNYTKLMETKESEFNEKLARLEHDLRLSQPTERDVTSSNTDQIDLLEEIKELKSRIKSMGCIEDNNIEFENHHTSVSSENVFLRQSIDSLKTDLENLKHLSARKQQEYEERIAELETLVNQSENTILTLQQNAQLQASTFEQFCSEKGEIETKCSSLETELSTLQQEFESKSHQYEKLKTEFDNHQSANESEVISTYEKDISELKSQLSVLSSQYEELQVECSLFKQDKTNCEEINESLKHQLLSVEENVSKIRLQLSTLETEHCNCKQLQDQLELERDQEKESREKYASNIVLVQSQVDTLVTQLQQLESEYSRVKNEQSASQHEIAELQNTLDETQTSVQNFKQQLSDQETVYEEAVEKYKTLELEHCNCKQIEERLKAEKLEDCKRMDVESQLQEVNSQLEMLQSEISIVKSEKIQLEECTTTLKTQIVTLENVTSSTQEKLDNLRSEHDLCSQLREQLETHNTKEKQLEIEYANAQSHCQELLKQHEDIIVKYDALMKEKCDYESVVRELNKSISEAENFNKVFKEESLAQESVICELKSEIIQVISKNKDLEESKENLQRQLKSVEVKFDSLVKESKLQFENESEKASQCVSSLQDDLTKANTMLNVIQGEKEVLTQQLEDSKLVIEEQSVKLAELEDDFDAIHKDYKVHYSKRNEFENAVCRLEAVNKKLETKVKELEEEIVKLSESGINEDVQQALAECQQELQTKSTRLSDLERKAAEYRSCGAQLQSQVDELTKEKLQLRRDLADKRGELAIVERKLLVEDLPYKKDSERLQKTVDHLENRIRTMTSEIRHLRSSQQDITFQHECAKCKKRTQHACQETQTSSDENSKSVGVQAPPDNETLWDRRDGYLPSSAITEAGRMYGMKQQLETREKEINSLQKERFLFKEELRKRNHLIKDLSSKLKMLSNKENQGENAGPNTFKM